MALPPTCIPCKLQEAARSDDSNYRATLLNLLRVLNDSVSGGSSIENQENFVQGQSGIINDTDPHPLVGMEGTAGEQIFITSLSITNGSEDVSTYVVVEDEDGAEIKRFYTSSGGGGADPSFPTAIPVPAGKGVYAKNITDGSETYVSAEGYRKAV